MSTNNIPQAIGAFGRVILVDPNQLIGEVPGVRTSTPPYEEMTPYVEMYCVRRRDSTIILGENGLCKLEKGEEQMKISMLNPDRISKQNTTLYTEDIVGVDKRIHNEGFGIDSIDIRMNPNYMPMVQVTFRDIRGTSLFLAGEDSPLAAIFEFPPPIYKLRIKGAFGRMVEYDLHLTDHNGGAVDTGTGDYTLKCNFIGTYYGPLTDMLLGYIKAVPFLKGEDATVDVNDVTTTNINGEQSKVNSFFELVNRGDLLYTAIDSYTKNNGASDEVAGITTQNSEIGVVKQRFQDIADPSNPEFKNFLKENKRESWASKVTVANDDIKKELSFVFSRDQIPDEDAKLSGSSFVYTSQFNATDEPTKLALFIKQFVEEIIIKPLATNSKVLGKTRPVPLTIDYRDKNMIKFTEVNTVGTNYEYHVDYSGLHQRLDTILLQNATEARQLADSIKSTLDSTSKELLGVGPTIGNIFRLLCNDFDYMVDRIRKAGEGKKDLKLDTGVTVTDASWPYVEVERTIRLPGGEQGKQYVQVYPGSVQSHPEYKQWPEVMLVEDYCRSVAKQQKAARQYTNFKDVLDPNKFVPVTTLEGIVKKAPSDKAVAIVNPYVGVANSLPQLYAKILQRYEVTKYFSYGEVFTVAKELTYDNGASLIKSVDFLDEEKRRILVKTNARLEAHNLWYVLQASSGEPIALAMQANKSKPLDDILREVENDQDVTLSGKGKLAESFNFRGNTLYNRKSNDFQGILEILEPPTTTGKSFYEVQTAPDNDPISQDRKRMLEEQADNGFFNDGASRKSVVTTAQTLLFPDTLAAAEGGKSDFLSASHVLPDLGNIFISATLKRGGAIGTYKNNLYDIISLFVLLKDAVTLRVFSAADTLTNKRTFFSLLQDSGKLSYFYEKFFSKFDDLQAKFLAPGTIEMPKVYALYLGYRFSKYSGGLPSWLSPRDRDTFVNYYNDFDLNQGIGGTSFISDLEEMRTRLSSPTLDLLDANGTIRGGSKRAEYYKLLDENVRKMASMADLLKSVYIVNASSLTFLQETKLTPATVGFPSLRLSDGTVRDRETLSIYLDEFHKELDNLLNKSVEKESKESAELQGKIQDNEFKSQVYYNFKAFYDRWITGTQNEMVQPGALYDRFKFVTRSHQNIADECIVDFSNFIKDSQNEDMSVFTSIGNLLQENKFMFFPLHSYMEYDGVAGGIDEWAKSFKINNHLNADNLTKPAFVCMFMGGFSSRLKTPSKEYGDDGFTFEKPPIDFDLSNGRGSLYAFRAKCGDQNQSVFGFPEWSMEEHKSTDVSLKMESDILDKPVDSRKVRKSQNLLSIYAQRSYTVGMSIPLGNMCIQPTQYFQLEGMPFLDGAFMVHDVSHTISAGTNRLETKFKGYRMGKYIQPIITQATLDYSGLDGETNAQLAGLGDSVSQSTTSIVGGNISDGVIKGLCDDKRFGYNYRLVRALLLTESAGHGGFVDGKMLINIAMNKFRQYVKVIPPAMQAEYAAIKDIPESQRRRHEILNTLRKIDNTAAIRATALGVGQIMGDNYPIAGKLVGGYTSPAQMFDSFSQSEVSQLYGVFSYIQTRRGKAGSPHLSDIMKTLDAQVNESIFQEIEHQYNGGENGYWQMLKKHYNSLLNLPIPAALAVDAQIENGLALSTQSWLSQGSDYTGCFRTCQRMINRLAPPNLGITVCQERNGILVKLANSGRGIAAIDAHLSRNQPIIVGVDHRPGSPNNDETTDHFVVVVSSGQDNKGKYYRFFDPGTGHQDLGTSPSNRLYENPYNGLYVGKSAYNKDRSTYTLSWVRPTA